MEYIAITIICVYLSEVGGLLPEIGERTKKIIGLGVIKKPLPVIGCAKCLTFWVILFTTGNLFAACVCSFAAPTISNLMITTNEILNKWLNKLKN